jgi:hypothetical protein
MLPGSQQSALALAKCTTHPVALCRLLGTTENALGLRDWLEERGHKLVVTSDKEGDDSELDKNLPDTDILITTVRILATGFVTGVMPAQPLR